VANLATIGAMCHPDRVINLKIASSVIVNTGTQDGRKQKLQSKIKNGRQSILYEKQSKKCCLKICGNKISPFAVPFYHEQE